MKKMISAVAVVALGASLAIAAPHGGMRGEHRGHRGQIGAEMEQKLNLTDTQKQQMKDMRASFKQQNEPLMTTFRQTMRDYRAAKEANDTARAESLKATLDGQKAQLKDARQAQHQQMLSILTVEQRAQLESMKAERKAKREARQQERQQNSGGQPQG